MNFFNLRVCGNWCLTQIGRPRPVQRATRSLLSAGSAPSTGALGLLTRRPWQGLPAREMCHLFFLLDTFAENPFGLFGSDYVLYREIEYNITS